MKYEILYKNVKIGVLEVNNEGKHRYTVDKEGIKQIENEASLTYDLTVDSDWREPIIFFKERLDSAERFSMEVIGYHTDNFRMVRIEERV